MSGPASSMRLYLHLTLRCNLSCSYCYTRGRRSETMPIEVGRRAIDFFLDRSEQLQLQFFGGEPLLCFDTLRELGEYALARARERGRRLGLVIVTNGTLLRPEVVDYCADREIDLSLSLDGAASAQDATRRFRGGQGSFAAIAPHLEHLLGRRPFTHVISVVNPDNLEYLPDSLGFLLEAGFRSIALSPDYTHPRFAAAVPEFERQLTRAAERYRAHVRQGGHAWVDLFDIGQNPYARERCRPAERDFSVDPLGRIYPCCCFVDHERYPVGSLEEGLVPALEAAFREEMERLARTIAVAHAACPEDSFCRKGCACTNLVATGRPSEIAAVTCAIGAAVSRVRASLASPH